MFKLIRGDSNISIRNAIEITYPQHRYETRNSNQLVTPFPRVDAIRYNFQYQFIRIWNEIPENIRYARSLNIFKRTLKEFLISEY